MRRGSPTYSEMLFIGLVLILASFSASAASTNLTYCSQIIRTFYYIYILIIIYNLFKAICANEALSDARLIWNFSTALRLVFRSIPLDIDPRFLILETLKPST